MQMLISCVKVFAWLGSSRAGQSGPREFGRQRWELGKYSLSDFPLSNSLPDLLKGHVRAFFRRELSNRIVSGNYL